jgi:chitobiase/beta-hexosaminidase-like protein
LVVQEEVKRESLGAIPYGPDEHKLNPYIGGNLQAINEFIKRDSELAAFYKQEAEPVSLPLIGPNRNLTVEGRLYRDPHTASVLKISRANEIGSGLRVSEADAAPQATWTVRRLPGTTPQWGFLVKIKTATPWAKLRYTLDGTTPTHNYGTLIPASTGKVPVTFGACGKRTLKAIAYKSGWTDSLIGEGCYVYTP